MCNCVAIAAACIHSTRISMIAFYFYIQFCHSRSLFREGWSPKLDVWFYKHVPTRPLSCSDGHGVITYMSQYISNFPTVFQFGCLRSVSLQQFVIRPIRFFSSFFSPFLILGCHLAGFPFFFVRVYEHAVMAV